MQKFENVDVLAALEQIMRQNTAFYQSDFQIDKEIIQRDAASGKAEDRRLLWMSRPAGTYCFRERDVLLKDTRQHNTWKFYGEQTRDRVLAYAVELTVDQGKTIRGNLYELDYQQHFQHVRDCALPVIANRLFYERGQRDIPAAQSFDGSPDRIYGDFLRYEARPAEPDDLRDLLQREQHDREQLKPGDFKAHVNALHDSLIVNEAQRIVSQMQALDGPNSPNKTHFMVELSPRFTQLASTKDTDRLFSMLPYKTLSFSKIMGRHGIYTLISKDESRDKGIRRPRPSIRAHLTAEKNTAAPKRTAAKSHNNELEV